MSTRGIGVKFAAIGPTNIKTAKPPQKTGFGGWFSCSGSHIIESIDYISRDERGFPLTQYITNGRISRARYTITHFKHHHRVLQLIANRMSV